MERFWTWGGRFIGFRSGDNLFTHRGTQVGRFFGDEIYGTEGRYLGEIRNQHRLITKQSKLSRRKSPFAPRRSGSYVPLVDYVGYVMYVGYQDFPPPEAFD